MAIVGRRLIKHGGHSVVGGAWLMNVSLSVVTRFRSKHEGGLAVNVFGGLTGFGLGLQWWS